MDRILYVVKKVVPKAMFRFLQPAYHWVLALAGAIWYRFPSRKLVVIGVTGTNGKSTVVEMLHELFSRAGYKTASLSSVRFKIGEDEIENRFIMSMPGRFFVEGFLRQARDAGATHVILEVTSEGIKQFRHKYIRFAAAVMTNLTPEHIESHGGFENYKKAKGKLFEILDGAGTSVVNLDDRYAEYFLSFPAKEKIGYTLSEAKVPQKARLAQGRQTPKVVAPARYEVDERGIRLYFREGWEVSAPLTGRFNAENMMAAIAVSEAFGVSHETMRRVFEAFKGVAGRMEKIPARGFAVIVDYAFTPNALRQVYATLKENGARRLICVLGGTGGGRDKWKRTVLGEIAGEHCAEVFVTNEDPYDENPRQIMDEVKRGVEMKTKHVRVIEDRREAIRAAISFAGEGDAVVVTGKGSEPLMVLARGEKISWDDRDVVREELKRLNRQAE
ncbi:MAG: UDP-N-acetylmuramoyl-L-alanyl-D-glutamate--2,6-diaminopimelate ligase [Candidatus Sungbacteria bacterium]|nr:UDP-N-acetylmuramoyl-L-alanyl-D-glutamate--2,6-diaminopimelate ligase [Candidatus Sungbacteria bacterium]